MTTEALPDATLLESLDFRPQCTIGHKPYSNQPPCDRYAEWWRRNGCCERDDLVCQPHYDDHQHLSAPLGFTRCTLCRRVTIATFTRIPR